MRKIWLGLVLGFLLTSVGWAADPPGKPLRVGTLSGITGLAMVRLMEPAGTAAPYEITVYKSPDLLVAKLVAGEVDLAALPLNTAAILYNKGVGVQITSVIGWGVLYVVAGDRRIKRWSDLKGKEIYLSAKGTVPDLLFRYLAAKNGLTAERDFTIHYLTSPVELAQLAASGKADLAVLPEPWVTEVVERNRQLRVVLDLQREWRRTERQSLTYPQSSLVVSKKALAAAPQAVEGFLKSLAASIRWVNRQPQAAGALAEKYVQINAGAVERGIKRCNLKYVAAAKIQTEINRFLERLGEKTPEAIGGKLPDEGFYYQP
jgi:NitT/TauT family transport system substrate-binding protein